MNDQRYLVSPDDTASGSNSDAVLTFTPQPGQRVYLASLEWSLSTTPAQPVLLTITDGAGVVYRHWITSSGPGAASWPVPRVGSSGQPMTIRLPLLGTNLVGTLNVQKLIAP